MRLLQSLGTDLCADSVEFCDTGSQCATAVCACYQLCADSGSRHGRLLQLSLSADGAASVPRRVASDCGLLDVSWAADTRRLWCAGSDGVLRLFAFDADDGLLCDSPAAEAAAAAAAGAGDGGGGNSVLALSVNWSPFGLAASFSDGSCSLLQPDAEVAARWRAHEHEAWVCARSSHCGCLAFSGGDDCRLRLWDCGRLSAATAALRHDAGVTMVTEHPTQEHIFLTGSYDDRVRSWDRRQLRSATSELDVGGGVWRLKFNEAGDSVLCAAMYAGFRVLRFCAGGGGLQLAEEFLQPHDSIAYGAAWCGDLCLTCSFYDRLLCVWRRDN